MLLRLVRTPPPLLERMIVQSAVTKNVTCSYNTGGGQFMASLRRRRPALLYADQEVPLSNAFPRLSIDLCHAIALALVND